MAFRVVQQSFWTDEKVVDLYSCEDKYFWLYLLTNPQVNQLGIYRLPLKIAAFQLGYSVEQVIVLLDRFEKVLKQIKYCKETQEIAIGYYLYHSVITGGAPVLKCAEQDIKKVKDISLIDFVINKMELKTISNKTVESILELLKEKSNKKENINGNDNDNDNGDSCAESRTESIGESQNFKKNKPPISPKGEALDFSFVNSDLLDAVKDFADMRKNIKAPLTQRGLELTVGKLDKMAENNSIKKAILEQSVMNGWKGVFELDEKVKEKLVQPVKIVKPERNF